MGSTKRFNIITEDTLNHKHGHLAKSFEDKVDAKRYAEENGLKFVTRLIDYKPDDVSLVHDDEGKHISAKVKDCSTPIQKGWLAHD